MNDFSIEQQKRIVGTSLNLFDLFFAITFIFLMVALSIALWYLIFQKYEGIIV